MTKTVFFISMLLIGAGISLVYARVHYSGEMLIPEVISETWLVEAKIVDPQPPRRVSIALGIPLTNKGSKLQEESMRSAGLAAIVIDGDAGRKLVWKGRTPKDQVLELGYTAKLERGTAGLVPPKALVDGFSLRAEASKAEREILFTFLEVMKKRYRSQDERAKALLSCWRLGECLGQKFLDTKQIPEVRKAKLLSALFANSGITSVPVRGFAASRASRNAQFAYWVRARIDGNWQDFFPSPYHKVEASDMIFWGYLRSGSQVGKKDSDRIDAADLDIDSPLESEVIYSLVPLEQKFANSKVPQEGASAWKLFSFTDLPIELRASLRVLLLMPVGALCVGIYRCLLGFPSFGTFMPVLVSLAFRETGLLWGVILLVVMVILGLFIRKLIGYLQLMLVPRLATTLSIVVLMIIILSKIFYEINFFQGGALALFPIVILTMSIERMCISWEEVGLSKSSILFLSSICCSVICYLAMSHPTVEYWLITFPEFSLVILGLLIALGRYTGFRLTEIYRFRGFLVKQS